MSVEWGSFDNAKEQCYFAMASGTTSMDAWDDAFILFRKGIVRMNMEKSDEQKMSLEDLEEVTGWEHDFIGWLQDYTDELTMRGEYGELSEVVDFLLKNFDEKRDVLELRSMEIECLWETGHATQAYEKSRKWLNEERRSVEAKAAFISACQHAGRLSEARKLIEKEHLFKVKCNNDNYGLFFAAAAFFKAQDDFKKAEKLETAMEIFDEEMEEQLLESCYEDEDGFF